MAVDKVSYRAIPTGQKFRNLGRWSWMLLRGKNNTRTRIITAYFPTVIAITGGAYTPKLEYLTIMKIKSTQELNFG